MVDHQAIIDTRCLDLLSLVSLIGIAAYYFFIILRFASAKALPIWAKIFALPK